MRSPGHLAFAWTGGCCTIKKYNNVFVMLREDERKDEIRGVLWRKMICVLLCITWPAPWRRRRVPCSRQYESETFDSGGGCLPGEGGGISRRGQPTARNGAAATAPRHHRQFAIAILIILVRTCVTGENGSAPSPPRRGKGIGRRRQHRGKWKGGGSCDDITVRGGACGGGKWNHQELRKLIHKWNHQELKKHLEGIRSASAGEKVRGG
jgi:hypothetical protein